MSADNCGCDPPHICDRHIIETLGKRVAELELANARLRLSWREDVGEAQARVAELKAQLEAEREYDREHDADEHDY